MQLKNQRFLYFRIKYRKIIINATKAADNFKLTPL